MSLEQMRRLIQEELAKQLDGEKAVYRGLYCDVDFTETNHRIARWRSVRFKLLPSSVQPKWLTSWLKCSQPT